MGLWQPKPAQERRCLLQLQLWRRRRLDHQRKRRTRRKRCRRRRFGSFPPSPPSPSFFPFPTSSFGKRGKKFLFFLFIWPTCGVGYWGGRKENDGKVDFFRGKSKQLHFLRYVRARGEVRPLELREMRGSRPSIDE